MLPRKVRDLIQYPSPGKCLHACLMIMISVMTCCLPVMLPVGRLIPPDLMGISSFAIDFLPQEVNEQIIQTRMCECAKVAHHLASERMIANVRCS